MSASMQKGGLRSDSTIAVLIPHFRCEQWLGGCLESLLAQTRLPEAIIVIDDASPVPPMECVRQFPSVTLLQAAENVGPYRLIQQVIDDTAFDGYMFQDADDWSGSRRLELLLAECERSGAELVGCQEMRLFSNGIDAEAHRFPVDARDLILSGEVGYPVLHPASLVSRSLVGRLGGYATGLRLSGDSEFQRRAIHCAHVTNIPEIAYFRRARPDSLTSSAETGRGTAVRETIQTALRARWKEARAAIAAGTPVDLSPMAVRGPVTLRHVAGRMLSDAGPMSRRRNVSGVRVPRSRRRSPRLAARPVFITGAPGSGLGLMYAALADHPSLLPVPGAVWLTRRIEELEHVFRGAALDIAAAEKLVSRRVREVMPPFQPEWRSDVVRTIEREQKRADNSSARSSTSVSLNPPSLYGRWVDASSLYALHIEQLIALFPDARFVHVLREPDEVVRSISSRGPLQRGTMTPVDAYTAWTRHVDACTAAERSLGPAMIRRVYHHELCSAPDSTIRGVLEFIGEPFAPACLTSVNFFASGERDSREWSESPGHTNPLLRACRLAAREVWETHLAFEKPTRSARSSSDRRSS